MEQEKPKSKIPTKEEFVQHMLFHGGYLGGGDRGLPKEPDYYVPLKDLDPDVKEEHPLVINDLHEFEHFRNVVTAFYNYKVTLFQYFIRDKLFQTFLAWFNERSR